MNVGDVIKSKIGRPQIGPKLVDRPQLNAFLALDRSGGITLVTAPAGYGKTTLVASWLQSIDQPAAWLSLKEEDNDPVSFCAHVVAAIRAVIPGFGRAIRTLMHTPGAPLEAAMTEIVNELAPRKRKLALVLDDYDIIANPAIHQALAFFIERQPQNFHLVVLSRSDPAFILSRLRSQARLLRLTQDDLRFNLEEAKRFFSETMNIPLPPERVEALLAKTEGWVAGLQLAALWLRHNTAGESPSDVFSAHRSEVTQFIIREVLSHLPTEVLSFLTQTAILDRLSAPLCDAVAGRNDSDAMLHELEQRHLFVVPLNHDHSWFRYHRLFAEALRALLAKNLSADTVRQLHARAATWLSQHQQIADALRHAKHAQDTELLADILDRHGLEWLNEGRITSFAQWLREIPPPIILKFPNLCGLCALTIYLGDGPDASTAQPFLIAAERLVESPDCKLSEEERQRFRGRLSVIRGFQARYAGKIPEAIEMFRQATDGTLSDEALQAGAMLSLAICYVVTNNFARAQQIFSPFAQINDAQPNYWISATSFLGLARIKVAMGKLNDAVELCKLGIDQFRARGLDKLPVCSILLMELGEIAYIQNRLEESQTLLEQAVELSSVGGMRLFHGCSQALLAQTRAARGLAEQLPWGQEEELKFMRTWGYVKNIVPPFGALVAKIWLMQGRHDDVSDWLERRGVVHNKKPAPEQEPDYLILVRLLCIQQRFDDAIGILDYMLASAEKEKRYGVAIEIMALLALAYQSKGDGKNATQTLHRALKLGSKENFVRTFLDGGEPMRILLRKALLQGVNAEYIRQLLDAAAPDESALQLNFAVPLSPKENEVASYLVTGMSNEEIASRMFLSLNTVKMHLKNLYRKLGASKRYDAIQKIREARGAE